MYAVSFYRTAESVSPIVGGVFSSIAGVGAVVGGIVGGKLVNRFGRKSLAVIFYFVSGVTVHSFYFHSNNWCFGGYMGSGSCHGNLGNGWSNQLNAGTGSNI